jgi:hypothetical protein
MENALAGPVDEGTPQDGPFTPPYTKGNLSCQSGLAVCTSLSGGTLLDWNAIANRDVVFSYQELLEQNKIRSRRRTIEPSIVQGLVSCQKCGYTFARLIRPHRRMRTRMSGGVAGESG